MTDYKNTETTVIFCNIFAKCIDVNSNNLNMAYNIGKDFIVKVK